MQLRWVRPLSCERIEEYRGALRLEEALKQNCNSRGSYTRQASTEKSPALLSRTSFN